MHDFLGADPQTSFHTIVTNFLARLIFYIQYIVFVQGYQNGIIQINNKTFTIFLHSNWNWDSPCKCTRMLCNTHALKTNRPLFRNAGSAPAIVTKHTGRVSTRVRVCKRWLLLVVIFYPCRGMVRGNIWTVCIVNGANICHSLTVKLHITRWVWCNICIGYTKYMSWEYDHIIFSAQLAVIK
jgi:hypothetical protein